MRKIKKKLLIISISLIILFYFGFREKKNDPQGPGMAVTLETFDHEFSIEIEREVYPSGKVIISGESIRKCCSHTSSFSGDTRKIPDWIEYEWKEVPYYKNDSRPMDVQLAEMHAQPLKRQRVLIASRVPQDVVKEVIESIKQTKAGDLSDKSLDVYFTWYKGHIYFSWRLHNRKLKKGEVERAGGDVCPLNGKPISSIHYDEECFEKDKE